jgi:cytochrome c-type biogenesis protein
VIGSVPLWIAVTAGGLAVVNPCGFPLLPAFLSFYLGADEERLPRAPTRVAQGLVVGAMVAAGFLAVFAAVGLPLTLGVGAIADAVPWVGLATGVLLALAGLGVIAGRPLSTAFLPHPRVRVRSQRRVGAMVLFGVGYGAASLGCTLPIFLALVGASLGADKIVVFVAYGTGMATVLTALSVTIACARQGLARRMRLLLRHVGRLAGLLLTASGLYLTYYWARIRFGDSVTLADDPVVGVAARYTAEIQGFAERHGSPLIAAAAAVVALAVASAIRSRLHRRPGAAPAEAAPQ